MSTFTIDIRNTETIGAVLFTATLDGTDFQIELRHNSRDNNWYMDLFDVAGNRLQSGKRCPTNFPLIRLLKNENKPAGELFCIDTRSIPNDPELGDLNVTNIFSYVGVNE